MIADNIAPVLTLTSAGFFVAGDTWWTTTSTPALGGTVSDASPVTVTATTPDGTVNATVIGAMWTGSVAGTLDLSGTDVTVDATDAAGNHVRLVQRVRADLTPPQLTFQPSMVNDEAGEVPSFGSDEAPIHTHTGAAIDLLPGGPDERRRGRVNDGHRGAAGWRSSSMMRS